MEAELRKNIVSGPWRKCGPAAAIGRLWQSAPRPVSRWRRWMAMAIPLPHVLGYIVLILVALLAFWGNGYWLGKSHVNGAVLERYESVMWGYRYTADRYAAAVRLDCGQAINRAVRRVEEGRGRR